MKASITFLNDYVDMSGIAPHDYAEDMTMSGTKVEGIEISGEEIKNVVAGKIISCEKHPDADKLQCCTVDVGAAEPIMIVTGATNIAAGDTVPVALHKSTLPGGVKITRGKLRGVMSNGMMCSHEELGMAISDYAGANENGILIIREDVKPGTDIKEVLGLNDTVVDFEITPNRADCYSVLGIARETAVTYGREFKLKKPKETGNSENISDMVEIHVENTALCPRYTARIVKNVKIAPSPKWLVERLRGCGVRSINNIVDITNFVMLEYGQPMHSFNLAQLSDKKIVVRSAAKGETITTLDGVEHALDESMLVIADGKKPVAVAGVMGGENSEITDDTSAILFESANFNGASVRVTGRKLGMRTEASARYEKGLDKEMTLDAVNRACELVELLGAGEVVGGVIDIKNYDPSKRRIPFNPDKINKFLGCDIDKDFMVKTLKSLEFEFDGDVCIPPSFRGDVEGSADLAEEVARFYGYDKIPATLLRGDTTPGGKNAKQLAQDRIIDILTGSGAYEIMTYSFISPKTFNMLRLAENDKKRETVNILNPLGEENSVMRTTTIGSMLETLATNYNYRNPSACLFEIGTVYEPTQLDKLPTELNKITVGMYGDCDFYDLKGIIEGLFEALAVKNVSYKADTENHSFHPGRCADVYIAGRNAGVIGEIHPSVCAAYSAAARVYVAELDFNTVFDNIDYQRSYVPLPKFPAVSRDIAVIVDDKTPAGDLESAIRAAAGKLLERVDLFDVYKGGQIGNDKKSVAYALTLRSGDRTLSDDEVTSVMDKIVKTLADTCGAVLR